MLHYCSEIVSAYYYSQLKKVTIKFQDGCRNYQLKMAVKNHKTCLFRSKFNLESLGMRKMLHYCPENVSAYYYSQLEIVTIKFQDGCQNISTQNGCQKQLNMPVLV